MYLPDDALSEIAVLGRRAKPKETCGVLLPSPWKGRWVVEIENTSSTPHDSFEFTTKELREALAEWFDEAKGQNPFDLVLWHTHPSGGVGPSRVDVQAKIKGVTHLVVALTNDGPVPSFY